MEEGLLKTISYVVKAIKKDSAYNYETYIQEIYDETEKIVDNYYRILNKTKHFLENHQRSLSEIIEFLEDERVEFRTIRGKVRSIVLTDSFYLKNSDCANFMRGVLGTLQGGLESTVLTDRGNDEVYHNHTINDIIEECKNKREYENDNNKIELCQELIETINEQEEELSKSWDLVCKSYIKIRKKPLNKFNK